MLEPAAESQLDRSSASRLVIRVKLIPQKPPQPSVRRRLNGRALLLILGAVAVLLSWLGISTLFRPDPTSPPAATEGASNSDSESSAPLAVRAEDPLVVSDEPLPKPATETTVTNSAAVEARSVESEVRQQPDAPPSTINEVIPDVPRSALETIRGTLRVAVRVTIDKQGTVVDAVAEDRGPSRYFERLAVEASKKWAFTPANSEERRIMQVRFNFTRAGATAHASPLQ